MLIKAVLTWIAYIHLFSSLAVDADLISLDARLSHRFVRSRDELQFICETYTDALFVPMVLTWLHDDGRRLQEIGVNTMLNEEYESTGRYDVMVDFSNGLNHRAFTLSINASVEDNGRFGCSLKVDNEELLEFSQRLYVWAQ